jgi:hypothetical protein
MPKFNYTALGIGAAFAIATAYSAYSTWDYVSSSLTTDGVVVSTPIGPHHPDVVFTDFNGERNEFAANGDISQNVGDRVRVRYRRDNPGHSARLDTFGSLWGTALFLLAMTAVFVIAGLRNVSPKGWGAEK